MGYFEVIPSDICDNCQERKEKATGRTITVDGLALMWFCATCKVGR